MQHLNTFGWNAFIFDAAHCFMAFRCHSHVPSFYFTLFQFNAKHTANPKRVESSFEFNIGILGFQFD